MCICWQRTAKVGPSASFVEGRDLKSRSWRIGNAGYLPKKNNKGHGQLDGALMVNSWLIHGGLIVEHDN